MERQDIDDELFTAGAQFFFFIIRRPTSST